MPQQLVDRTVKIEGSISVSYVEVGESGPLIRIIF